MPEVKSRWLFLVSMALALVAVGYVADRLIFLARAEHTTGEVVEVTSRNDSCKTGKSGSYPCTVFTAQVRYYSAQGVERSVEVRAGVARGRDRRLSHATYKVGSPVEIIYNPRRASEAYRDYKMDIWGKPLFVLFGHLATLFGSFTARRGAA